MPNEIQRTLQNRIANLDRLISAKTASVASAPDGKLKVFSIDGHTRYLIKNKEGKWVRINKSAADTLAQRKYDIAILRSAAKEKTILSRALNSYPDPCVEDVYSQLPQLRKPMVHPIRLSDDEFTADWLATPFKQKTDDTQNCIFKTKHGDMVRSKSELIIANRLFELDIPYRYEAELRLGNTIIHPDFTILDIRRRREVYLEHCGRMDDPAYSSKVVKRVNLYIKNNILPGDRLFLSLESLDVPLNMEILDKILMSLVHS